MYSPVPTSTTTSTSSSTSSTSTSSTSTSSTSSSTTSTTTTQICTPIINGNWTFIGPSTITPFQVAVYTVTMNAPNSSSYPVVLGRTVSGGTTSVSTLTFNSAGSQTITVNWDGTPNGNFISTYVGSSPCGNTSDAITINTTALSTSTTTSTSTTAAPGSVTITPLNSLSGSSYTPFINGSADASWDFGTRSYPAGTSIYINYAQPACYVTLNGSVYTSGNPITIVAGQSYTFQLKNYNNWVNNGAQGCLNNAWVQPIINDCGNVDYIVIDDCSCNCNSGCDGTYWGGWYCDNNQTKRSQYYTCNNVVTGNVEINPDCTVACTGTYFSDSCNGGTTLTRTQKYSCNNANTGVVETYPCSGACGASTSQHQGGQVGTYYTCSGGVVSGVAVYVNDNGCYTGPNIYLVSGTWQSTNPSNAYPNTTAVWVNTGGQYCISGSCTLRQNQVQTNPCATGTTRTINTGTVSESCGSWDLQYYCVGLDLWSQEVNYCTSATRNQQLVQVNSIDCGYVPPSYSAFDISTSANEFNVCTRAVDQTAYCIGGSPSVGKTIYTDSIGSSTLGSGYYATNSGFIVLNGSGVVTSDGIC